MSRHYMLTANGSLWDRSPFPNAEFELLVGKEQSEGGYSLVRGAMDFSVPEHVHLHDDESTYLLEGEMIAQIEDEQFHLKPGDFLYMPRKKRHQLIIDSPIRMLNIQTPGGILDGLMEEMVNHIAAGNELDAETYAEMQVKHGILAPDGWVEPSS